jgi:hypothetical protein
VRFSNFQKSESEESTDVNVSTTLSPRNRLSPRSKTLSDILALMFSCKLNFHLVPALQMFIGVHGQPRISGRSGQTDKLAVQSLNHVQVQHLIREKVQHLDGFAKN